MSTGTCWVRARFATIIGMSKLIRAQFTTRSAGSMTAQSSASFFGSHVLWPRSALSLIASANGSPWSCNSRV